MRPWRLPDARALLPAALILGLGLAATGAERAGGSPAGCAPRLVSPGYERALTDTLASGRDVLGERLLRQPGGPTYAAAARLVPPLLLARTSKQRPLTSSGVYYVPSAQPGGPQGAGAPMLLLADGSEVRYGAVGGPRLAVRLAGGERFGSCLRRSAPARLADGYLPIVQTAYVDAHGGRFSQEAFAARLPDGTTAAYVRVTGSAASFVTRAGSVPASRPVVWAPRRSPRAQPIEVAEYERARTAVIRYWHARLAEGASISVPEARVMNAQRASLIQNLMLTWRYSIGNPYEEFSFPESLDGAQVLAEYGFADVAQSIVRTSLTRRPVPYPAWKMGEKLLAAATTYRLLGDPAFLERTTPALRSYVGALARSQRGDGLLARERYSSDIPDSVLGLHAQAIAWQGLHAMAGVWTATGDRVLARRAEVTARRLRIGLRAAVARSVKRPSDGSLFVPMRLLADEPAYRVLPQTRDGSYWNLVAPYALASGVLGSHAQEQAALRYLLGHGSRFLGVVRAGAFSLYGHTSSSTGLDQVYGVNAARFLASLDEPDLLVLSLYGTLAAALTRDTFVGGEASSLSPVRHAYYRSMYLPPNSVANAALLETLRLLVVNELPEGQGLQLAYATPRPWLAPGKRIAVDRLPTRFGPLSYTLGSHARSVSSTISVPRIGGHSLSLRLRLPGRARIASVRVNGRPLHAFNARTGTIDLTGRGGSLAIEVALAR
jgi:hypothetical protein